MPGCGCHLADGLQEMGLSKSDTTVDEERGGPAGFCHGQRCRMGESIVWTHDEAVEGVVGLRIISSSKSGWVKTPFVTESSARSLLFVSPRTRQREVDRSPTGRLP